MNINEIVLIKKTKISNITINIIRHKNNLLTFTNLLYIFVNNIIKKYSNQTIGINKTPHISIPYLNNTTIIKLAFSYW